MEPWAALVLESKLGGNIRVNILHLTRGWEPWSALGLESKFGGNIRVNILYLTRGYGALGGSGFRKVNLEEI